MPRFWDLDTWRHVNNTAMVQLHQEARVQALVELLGADAWFSDGPRLRPLRSVTQFRRVTRYGAPVISQTRIQAVSGQHFRMRTDLFQHDECVGCQDSIMGAFLDCGPVELPGPQRTALQTADIAALEGSPEPLAPPVYLDGPELAEAFAVVKTLTPRYGDLDVDSQRAESALARYVEQSRFGVVDRLPFGGQGMLIALLDMTFHHYRAGSEPVELAAAVPRVGNSSFSLRTSVFSNGKPQATADSIMVVVNTGSERPEPMNSALCEQLATLDYPGSR
jgi:acyl-CoA thioesterase FadM